MGEEDSFFFFKWNILSLTEEINNFISQPMFWYNHRLAQMYLLIVSQVTDVAHGTFCVVEGFYFACLKKINRSTPLSRFISTDRPRKIGEGVEQKKVLSQTYRFNVRSCKHL